MANDFEYSEARTKFQEKAIVRGDWHCCGNCEYWREGEEKCDYYKMRPPVNVILVGCTSWQLMIPF